MDYSKKLMRVALKAAKSSMASSGGGGGSYRPTYTQVVSHDGLNKRRVISGKDPDMVALKAQQQTEVWEEEWRRKQAVEFSREVRAQDAATTRQAKEQRKNDAAAMTEEAQRALAEVRGILHSSAARSHVVNWDEMKDTSPYPTPPPPKPRPPAPPTMPPLPPEPSRASFQPVLGALDKLVESRRRQRIAEAHERYQAAMQAWNERAARSRAESRARTDEHQRKVESLNAQYTAAVETWRSAQREFLEAQARDNTAIDALKDDYLLCTPGSVEAYCEMVLLRSQYPGSFPQSLELDYNPDSELLVVDYDLPRMEDLPQIREVKYIQSRDEFSESPLPERDLTALYDNVVYQMALRTLFELYDSDVVLALQTVVFNGWVTSVDKATGKEVTSCIMSLQTTRDAFTEINLAEVEPRACFRSLKGVCASKLHSLTPVAPVLTISREDSRFVASHDVTDGLDDSSNLAAMDWEEFEHLIRELFEEEFAQAGGEVKVTRASRDGGVDAVAFDPDPIRGGKIVIQAKRYTNTVGVSAVRDLYGTVVNEGATKGILVSTSDYGPDAYEFAKGKPLTLLNGGHLLHLLGKHGHKAKIDIAEARKVLAEREAEERRGD